VFFLLKKWLITHTAVTNMEMSVAIAAPRIPHSNTNRNSGARIQFRIAPIMLVSIALPG